MSCGGKKSCSTGGKKTKSTKKGGKKGGCK